MAIQLKDHFTFSKILRFTFPSVIMMIFTSIYGIVDGFFVSNYVGKTAFASVNLIMPFIMITSGIGFVFGTGGSALVSLHLGKKENLEANRYFTMMIAITIILGTCTSVIGFIFMKQIAILLGATPAMTDTCVLYGRINMIFNVPFMLQTLFQALFITAQKPKLGLYTTVVAGISNMLFDYILIAVFPLGITGAALATGISQCIGGFFPILYFARKNTSLLHIVRTKLEFSPILRAASNGASEFMSNISSSLVSMLFNMQLLKYLEENGVAAYGVIMYVQFIFIAIFIGYTVGISPVISYHYGAENYKEVRNLRKKSYLLIAVSSILLCTVCRFCSPFFASLFVGYSAELLEITIHAFSLYCFTFLFSGFNTLTSAFFTALNNGRISACISFVRTLLFQTGSVLVLPLLLQTDGIWLSPVCAEILAMAVSGYFLLRYKAEYKY